MIVWMSAFISIFPNQVKAPQGWKLWNLLPMDRYLMCNSFITLYYLHLLYRSTFYPSVSEKCLLDLFRDDRDNYNHKMYPNCRARWTSVWLMTWLKTSPGSFPPSPSHPLNHLLVMSMIIFEHACIIQHAVRGVGAVHYFRWPFWSASTLVRTSGNETALSRKRSPIRKYLNMPHGLRLNEWVSNRTSGWVGLDLLADVSHNHDSKTDPLTMTEFMWIMLMT